MSLVYSILSLLSCIRWTDASLRGGYCEDQSLSDLYYLHPYLDNMIFIDIFLLYFPRDPIYRVYYTTEEKNLCVVCGSILFRQLTFSSPKKSPSIPKSPCIFLFVLAPEPCRTCSPTSWILWASFRTSGHSPVAVHICFNMEKARNMSFFFFFSFPPFILIFRPIQVRENLRYVGALDRNGKQARDGNRKQPLDDLLGE